MAAHEYRQTSVRGIGTAANVATVLAGTTAGLLLRRTIPSRVRDAVPQALGIFTVALGVRQALQTENVLLMLGGLLTGVALGAALSLDARLESLLARSERRLQAVAGELPDGGERSLAHGRAGASPLLDAAVLPSLVFCIGPMTLIGAVQDGARGEPGLLVVKAVMDGFTSIAFAAGLGPGVYLSALFVLVFQGSLTLAAGVAAPLLSERVVTETTAVGGLIVMAIGVKLLKVKSLPVVDYLPALITTPLLVLVVQALT